MPKYILLSKFSSSNSEESNFAKKFERHHSELVKNFPNAKFLERGYLENSEEYIEVFEVKDPSEATKISLMSLKSGAKSSIAWSEPLIRDYISEQNFITFK